MTVSSQHGYEGALQKRPVYFLRLAAVLSRSHSSRGVPKLVVPGMWRYTPRGRTSLEMELRLQLIVSSTQEDVACRSLAHSAHLKRASRPVDISNLVSSEPPRLSERAGCEAVLDYLVLLQTNMHIDGV